MYILAKKVHGNVSGNVEVSRERGREHLRERSGELRWERGNYVGNVGTWVGTWEQTWELGWERVNMSRKMNLLLGLCLRAWGRLGGFLAQLGVCIWEHCVYWVILISMPNSITCIVYTAYNQY